MLTTTDYENLLVLRYQRAGMSGASALYFARGEIAAIQEGRHWTHGNPTAPDSQRLIFQTLSDGEREQFMERAAILEYDGGMNRADAEARAIVEIIKRKYPAPVAAPEKLRAVYQGLAAIKHTVSIGIGIKEFFAKSGDNDTTAYTTDLKKITALWNEGRRRFKAFIRGRFLVLDIDRKPGKPDGLETFYKLFTRETMPETLRNIPDSFPCYVTTPSCGYHLYFRYNGPELKIRELAAGVEVKEWQITVPGSGKENGDYILHGDLNEAPPLYGLIIDAIEEAKREKERTKAERLRPRTKAAADRPVQYEKPRITLEALADEAASAYTGHYDRQVSFAGRACRCKFSGAATLAYVKALPDIFGSGSDTESTILSVFRDNGAA
jgi:hypothetical protein